MSHGGGGSELDAIASWRKSMLEHALITCFLLLSVALLFALRWPHIFQRRIFEPFFSTKKKGQGTGLGLSTVHALVQSGGGFIEVDSQLGKGTVFRIFLPSYRGEQVVAQAASCPPLRHGSETILIADDDAQVREILARRLRDFGYRAIVCQDGEEALREYRRQPDDIALVISDAVMPKLSGRELQRLLSSEYGELPFLICSGYAAQTIEPTFFDHPLRSYLQKPFDDQTLQARVRALLDAAPGTKRDPVQALALARAPMAAKAADVEFMKPILP